MKHLKLFEAYTEINKESLVNTFFMDFFIFSYFVENDIIVQKNLDSYTFYKPHWTGNPKYNRPIIEVYKSRKYIEPFFYTDRFFEEAFRGYVDKLNTERISETVHRQNGVKKATIKYIKYLEKTPEKKHLLQE